jgi:hypothetical protein
MCAPNQRVTPAKEDINGTDVTHNYLNNNGKKRNRRASYELGAREFESLRARQMTKGPLVGPFFILGVLDEDEDCCSIKRASVLDAAGAPQG